MKRPIGKRTVVTLFLMVFFVIQNIVEKKVGVVRYGDELLAVAAVPLLLWKWKRSRAALKDAVPGREWRVYLLLMALFWACGWMGTFLHHYVPFGSAAKDAIANVKFFLTTATAYLLYDSEQTDFRQIREVLWWLTCVLSGVMAVMTLIGRIFWLWYDEVRAGQPAILLLYNSYATLLCICVFLGAVALRFYDEKGKKILVPLGLLIWVIYNARRVKGIAAIGVLALIYIFVFHRKRVEKWMKFFVAGFALMAGVGVVIQLKRYIGLGLTTARAVLTVSAPFVAWDHLPFGSGWGSYASFFSAEPYSQLYLNYHMDKIWGMSPDFHDFIADTFWPMIMGETGFLGFAAYVGALFLFLRWVLRSIRTHREAFASGLALVLYLFISSTGESAFANPMTISFAFWLGYLAAECRNTPAVGEECP